MEKVYLLCDEADSKARKCGAWNVGVEFMGTCRGRVVSEDGIVLGAHTSSSIGWLRSDLSREVDLSKYEIVDLLEQPVPERFSLTNETKVL